MGELINLERQRKLRSVIDDILVDLNEYFRTFKRPARYQDITRRYNRQCHDLKTSFRQVLLKMQELKIVHIEMLEGMSRRVWPYDMWEAYGKPLWLERERERAAKRVLYRSNDEKGDDNSGREFERQQEERQVLQNQEEEPEPPQSA